ncbi:hypothetical protein CYFUS_003139 [Cystobacter fuscus]|uniref:Uncharacterized protein n=1 Tax=Cystobacter fuscus TaxID=43 RepID=A0A250J149_9BACT|nr:hypothetical protein CYFUS_003139 [Cystobacter fuscus]
MTSTSPSSQDQATGVEFSVELGAPFSPFRASTCARSRGRVATYPSAATIATTAAARKTDSTVRADTASATARIGQPRIVILVVIIIRAQSFASVGGFVLDQASEDSRVPASSKARSRGGDHPIVDEGVLDEECDDSPSLFTTLMPRERLDGSGSLDTKADELGDGDNLRAVRLVALDETRLKSQLGLRGIYLSAEPREFPASLLPFAWCRRVEIDGGCVPRVLRLGL